MVTRVYMRRVLLEICALVVIILLSGLSAAKFANFYEFVAQRSLGGSFLDFSEIVGFLFGILFFLSIFFGSRRYVTEIMSVLLMILIFLLLLFFAVADFPTFYFPVLLGLFGYGIGWGIRKFLLQGRI